MRCVRSRLFAALWLAACGGPAAPNATTGSETTTAGATTGTTTGGAGGPSTSAGVAASSTTGHGASSTTTAATSTSSAGSVTSGTSGTSGGSSSGGTSPSCTVITGAGESITDAQGNGWSIAGGVAEENGAPAGYSANVVEVAFVAGAIYQENSAHGWWVWSGGTWVTASNPTGPCGGSGASGTSGTSGTTSTGGSGTTSSTGGEGTFQVAGGQIIAPDGQPFIGKGIDLPDFQMSAVSTDAAAQPLASLFSGITIVRLACYGYNDPTYYQTFVDQLTSLGIVVEIEDHQSSDGTNSGGGTGVVFTGQLLQQELSWYSALATAYADNPYVWFGTDNEPPENPSAAALSTWQGQTYGAVRGAGANNIVLIEMNCDTNPSDCGAGYTASVYATMTNVAWDSHFYGWVVGYSTDMTTIAQSIAGEAAAAQLITSADGVMPIVIGEYGNSTDGQNLDANGTQVVTAVEQSGFTSMAWWWGGGSGDIDNLTDSGSLTDYGQQVAQYIAQ